MAGKLKIGVMGAGAVGCYIGGLLAAAGDDVVFIGRPRLQSELAQHGLTLTDLDGVSRTVAPDRVVFSTDPSGLADCDVILVCVKSAQTAEAGDSVARVVAAGAVARDRLAACPLLRDGREPLDGGGGLAAGGNGQDRPLSFERRPNDRLRSAERELDSHLPVRSQ